MANDELLFTPGGVPRRAHSITTIGHGNKTVATAGTELPITAIVYSTGTITVTLGSNAVVGVGTTFTTNVSVGDKIETAGGKTYTVHAVNSATSLSLSHPASATEAGITYKAYTANRSIKVVLKADNGNANNIYIGNIGLTSSTGFELDAGKEITLYVDNNSSNLYVDAGANAQVLWVFIEKGGTMQAFTPTSITHGQRAAGGAPAAVQLIATKINTTTVYIEALTSNSDSVYIGDSTVSATTGFELVPGGVFGPINVNDADADIYFYASATEGVSYLTT